MIHTSGRDSATGVNRRPRELQGCVTLSFPLPFSLSLSLVHRGLLGEARPPQWGSPGLNGPVDGVRRDTGGMSDSLAASMKTREHDMRSPDVLLKRVTHQKEYAKILNS